MHEALITITNKYVCAQSYASNTCVDVRKRAWLCVNVVEEIRLLQAWWYAACCGYSDGGGLRSVRNRITAKTQPPQLRELVSSFSIGSNFGFCFAVVRMHCLSIAQKQICILGITNAFCNIS